MESPVERIKHLKELASIMGTWGERPTIVGLDRVEYVTGIVKFEVTRKVIGFGVMVVCVTADQAEAEDVYQSEFRNVQKHA